MRTLRKGEYTNCMVQRLLRKTKDGLWKSSKSRIRSTRNGTPQKKTCDKEW